ncbi:MAG: endonuclease/exonuclease/phosphatase family protein [Paludibacteraceae bacterium]|nr:endonuclease/exonuclease/phosphatase family protein [Paludibacteraceae bacterium]
MLRKIKIICWSLLVIVVLWLAWSLLSHRMPWQEYSQMPHELKVLTYNTQGMAVDKYLDTKLEMLEYINKLDADVVCLQEVLVYKKGDRLTLPMMREAMKNYPYTYFDFKLYNSRRQFGNVVFSRYPLVNKETIQFESKANISSQCDIVVNEDTIRLMVNHLESFYLNDEDLDLSDLDVSNIQENSLVRKLLRANRLRHDQVSVLRKAIRQSPHPVIAVGDFNSLPISWVYWRMNLGMRDCFAESSVGQYGSTYQRKGMSARIDYIFTSRKLKPISCEVGDAEYSDHYPVMATIGW